MRTSANTPAATSRLTHQGERISTAYSEFSEILNFTPQSALTSQPAIAVTSSSHTAWAIGYSCQSGA